MRHLRILPCPEAWEHMQPDGDGRFCARCQLHVTEVSKLDAAGLAALGADPSVRSCARFELHAGRPRTKLGIAAGLLVVTVGGCATVAEQQPLTQPELERSELSGELSGSIAGVVLTTDKKPAENAVVVLQSSALAHQLERLTSGRGVYVFTDLPPGNYTIQVLIGKANVSRISALAEGQALRVDFTVDPTRDTVLGMFELGPASGIDSTSASSTLRIR